MRPKGIPEKTGFTLMETLIAISVFTIIAAAIYSSLNAGIRVWKRSNKMIEGLQAARVFFALASADLRNAVIYNPEDVNFEGSGSAMAFMSVITAAGRERAQSAAGLARVAYYFDSRTGTVKRAVAGKAQGFDIAKANPATVFTGAAGKDISFEYCYKPEAGKTGYKWEDKWKDSKKIPMGVRIRAGGFIKYIFIPTGEPGEET